MNLNEFRRAEELCRIMRSIVGNVELRSDTRVSPVPMLRAMVFSQMKKEGFTVTAIGRAFGRDHSTVTNMYQKWDAIARENNGSWRDHLSIWDAFQRLIKEKGTTVERGDEGMTVAYIRLCISNLPADASVVIEKGRDGGLKYNQELNTLFIRG